MTERSGLASRVSDRDSPKHLTQPQGRAYAESTAESAAEYVIVPDFYMKYVELAQICILPNIVKVV